MKTVIQVIRDRRSQKTFSSTPVRPDDIRTMIDAAVLAPNHKLTQPWVFAVMGKRARAGYGEIRAQLRVSQEADPAVAADKRTKIIAETNAVPAVIVVLQKLEGDAHRKREDYAAIFMAIENMMLVAVSLGLAT